ncbi:MAG: hypothetical protein Q7U54_15570 [Bacteroidales bacterium]|nr:hypothetical protein [Bacteroidales bacterium]
MLTEIYIYTAADAFLYLPVYIAKELKIFKSLLKDDSISIIFPDIKTEGDINAIQEMLSMNENAIHNRRKNIIPICISDPTAFLSKKIGTNFDVKECVVIGALINKIPFWAVDRHHIYYDSFEKLCASFTDVIYYDKELLTGHHLGKRFIKQNEDCIPHLTKKVGAEFEVLNNTYEGFKSRGENDKSAVALTADIVTVVKGLMEKEKNENADFSVNYYFSREKDTLISTGILTTKQAISKRENYRILCKIVEGIQKSISIIESSEEIATDICLRVATEKKMAAIDKEVARKIIERINDENFYPADLNIDKKEWDNSIIALGKNEGWTPEKLELISATSYNNHVNDEFLKYSLREISKQFGITKEVFRTEIDTDINSATAPIKAELEDIRRKYSNFEKWDKFTIFMGKCQVAIFKFFRRPFVNKKRWIKSIIWSVLATLVLMYISAILIDAFGFVNDKIIAKRISVCSNIIPVILTLIFALPTIKDWMKKLGKNDSTRRYTEELQ